MEYTKPQVAIVDNTTIALTDAASGKLVEQLNPLLNYLEECWTSARNAKLNDEKRALRAYRNFRGLYGPDTVFLDTEKSRAFIKISKTKVMAAYAQVLDVLFSGGRLPVEITSSPEPLGVPDVAHVDPNDPLGQGGQFISEPVLGFPGDGNDLAPGATIGDRVMQWAKAKFQGMAVKLKEGAGASPASIVLTPAKDIARAMNKRVHDQLEEGGAIPEIKKAAFEQVMLGTGILRGPLNVEKEYPEWDAEGNYIPTKTEIPELKFVSFWDFYPDPQATAWKDAEYAIERMKLSRTNLRDLQSDMSFRSEAIDQLLMDKPVYEREWFENDLIDNKTNQDDGSRFVTKSFWGTIDRAVIEASGISFGFPLPEDVKSVRCNAWWSGRHIIRLVLNPYKPYRLPYFVCPYETHPYSIFGVGLVENMEDSQMLMNGFARLSVDNAVLSGSAMLEVDESMLAPGQDYKISSGKVFRKMAGPPGTRAINSIQITNTSGANLQMFDMARRLADESTGIPSFSHGLTGVQGVGRTAGGISMLMGAASLTTKAVVSNIDTNWLIPLGQAWYNWNMQFKFDPKLVGDLSVVARGVSNLMQKEVKAQKLIQLAQSILPNQYASSWIKWQQWAKQLAVALEIDIEELINNPDEAALQAKLTQFMQQQAGEQGGGGQPAGPTSNIPGEGPPALPGEDGFSASSGADVMAERGAMNAAQRPTQAAA
jgi:hypothetical protein